MEILVPFRVDVYNSKVKAPYYNPAKTVTGFKWDELIWTPYSLQNRAASIPLNFDTTFPNIPEDNFQSGIGSGQDLIFAGFDVLHRNDFVYQQNSTIDCTTGLPGDTVLSSAWIPRIENGHYFIQKNKGYLFPNGGITIPINTDTVDGNSVIDLPLVPESTIPIAVTQYGYDEDDIAPIHYFDRVMKFSGIIRDGKELDTTHDKKNIDKTKYEFIVEYNEWEVPKEKLTTVSSGPEYNFVLDNPPLYPYPISFTREDIFRTELDYEVWVERKHLGTLEEGDYYIGYTNGASPPALIEVYLSEFTPPEFGAVSYTKDYPAHVSLNDNYIEEYTETIGTSDGNKFQEFHTSWVPIVDFSTALTLDTTSLVLAVVSPAGVSETWTRVDSLLEPKDPSTWDPDNPSYRWAWDDKIFELDSDKGMIRFGAGSTGSTDYPGFIPEWGSSIQVVYKSVPVVQYMPVGGEHLFSDSNLNLNPAFNMLTRGFLYLSSKQLIPAKLELETYTPFDETQGYYGPVTFGSQNIVLRARVLTSHDEPVPNILVRFESEPDLGSFASDYAVSNTDGYAYNRYDLGATLGVVGYTLNFYEALLPGTWGWSTDVSARPDSQRIDGRNPNIPTEVLDPIEGGEPPLSTIGKTSFFGPDGKSIYLPGDTEGIGLDELDEIAVFVVYNDNSLNPYDGWDRDSGRWNILSHLVGTKYEVLHPSSIDSQTGYVTLNFDSVLPQPTQTTLFTAVGLVAPNGYQVRFPGTLDSYYSMSPNFVLHADYKYKGDYFPIATTMVDGDTVVTLDREILSAGLADSGNSHYPKTITMDFHNRNYHIVQYLVSSSSILTIGSYLPCTNKIVKSEDLQFLVTLPPQWRGTFILDPGQPGSVIGGVTYLNLNEIELTTATPDDNIPTSGLNPDGTRTIIRLEGLNFPIHMVPHVWVDEDVIPDGDVIVHTDELIEVYAPAHAAGYTTISVGAPIATPATKLIRYV